MFGSVILEVAAGLTLVFLVLSAACSAIREAIEAWMKLRAVDLERTLREMLDDPSGEGLTSRFFQHPLISGLYPGDYDPLRLNRSKEQWLPSRTNLPSYIPGALFAQALLDLQLRPDNNDPTAPQAASGPLQQILLAAQQQTDGTAQALRDYLKDWYDAAMERTSGWYRRYSQRLLFLLGLLLTISLNADALRIADSLYHNSELRQAMLQRSEAATTAQLSPDEAKAALADLRSAGLSLGWSEQDIEALSQIPASDTAFLQFVKLFAGWLITALAISQGAPFWFDLLNHITSLRSTLKPPAKSSPAPG